MFPNRIRAVAAACCVAAFAIAFPAARPDDEKDSKPPAERTFTFRVKDAPWSGVLKWYAELGKLRATVKVKPAGTFTFTPSNGSEFTLAEITDVINEGLMKQKLLLIPYHKSFTVVAADGKIDPKYVPTVELSDLAKLAKTALVEAAIPLPPGIGSAEDVADELKKLLTPFGEILVAKGKWLIIRETAGNIRRIRATLETC